MPKEYARIMSRGMLLAAALLLPAAPPASIDFGSVQLGGAASRRLAVPALAVTASGAGFSAARIAGGVLIVFEPYELHEEVAGRLTLRMQTGLVRIALHGRGIDTLLPAVSVETPHAVRAGRTLTLRFTASDNDLVRTCTLAAGGHRIARLPWPVSTFRWHVPRGLGGRARITVVAVDRAGNRGTATSRTFTIQ
jgi:hypothetical protein